MHEAVEKWTTISVLRLAFAFSSKTSSGLMNWGSGPAIKRKGLSPHAQRLCRRLVSNCSPGLSVRKFTTPRGVGTLFRRSTYLPSCPAVFSQNIIAQNFFENPWKHLIEINSKHFWKFLRNTGTSNSYLGIPAIPANVVTLLTRSTDVCESWAMQRSMRVF